MTVTDRHHEHREPVDGCWRCWRRRHELLNGGSDGCRCMACRSREVTYKPRGALSAAESDGHESLPPDTVKPREGPLCAAHGTLGAYGGTANATDRIQETQ